MSEEPFGKILKADFELRGLESMKHAAHLQYRLLLLDPVLRAHIDYPKKSVKLVYKDPKDTQLILDTLKPVRATLKSREAVSYEGLVDEGFHRG